MCLFLFATIIAPANFLLPAFLHAAAYTHTAKDFYIFNVFWYVIRYITRPVTISDTISESEEDGDGNDDDDRVCLKAGEIEKKFTNTRAKGEEARERELNNNIKNS